MIESVFDFLEICEAIDRTQAEQGKHTFTGRRPDNCSHGNGRCAAVRGDTAR